MRPLTRSCFLLRVLGRLFLLALPFLLPSLWTPPFPLRAPALIPLYLAKVRLLLIDFLLPHDLVLGRDGSVPFSFGKSGSGVLANCFLCGTEATLSFSEGPVCSSFSAEACTILHALCWSRHHQQVCRFSSLLLLSDSRFVLTTLFSLRLSFYFNLSGRSGRYCLFSPVLSGYNGSPDTRFSRGTMRMMSWQNGEHYSCPPQFLVISLVLSLVSPFLFSRTGGVLSHLNSLTHRFPRFASRNLCSLVMLAVFSFVFAPTDTAFC